MGGRHDPPEGGPEGTPGGDDEFRSVVFDESFVRAARIQELSARERMGSAARAVRRRSTRPFATLPRQAFALMLLIAVAFAVAVYMGVRHPYQEFGGGTSQLTVSVVPLAPGPGATASPEADGKHRGDPFAPLERAAGSTFYDGSVGLVPPAATATRHFSVEQVGRALAAVQQYLFASSLDSKVLVEGGAGGVRDLLATGQRAQFDSSVGNPRDDLHHAATGWLVRFDPAEVTLAVSKVKVAGGMTVSESDDETLEVVTDHTLVYALQAAPQPGAEGSATAAAATTTATGGPTGSSSPTQAGFPGAPSASAPAVGPSGSGGTGNGGTGSGTEAEAEADQRSVPGEPVTLFTVRRELRFRFSRVDIGASQLQLVDAVIQAGPMACDAHTEQFLRPILAGEDGSNSGAADRGTGSAAPQTPSASGTRGTGSPSAAQPQSGIDPLDRLHRPAWQVCGVLTGPMASLPAG
jgi:hypothetical protein